MACLKSEYQAHDAPPPPPPFLCVTRDAMFHSPSWVVILEKDKTKTKHQSSKISLLLPR